MAWLVAFAALLRLALPYPLYPLFPLRQRAGPSVPQVSAELSPYFSDDPFSPEPSLFVPTTTPSPSASVTPRIRTESTVASPSVSPTQSPTISGPNVAEETPEEDDMGEMPFPDFSIPADQLENGLRTTCFAGGMRIETREGWKRIEDVEVGEWIWTGEWEQVLLFTHRMKGVWARFMEIEVGGKMLRVSEGHFVYVGGEIKAARDVRVGELMQVGGAREKVRGVRKVWDRGVYNFQTKSGEAWVEGIRVSTYTEAVRMEIAHALLAPVRAVWDLGGRMSGLDQGWPRGFEWLVNWVGEVRS